MKKLLLAGWLVLLMAVSLPATELYLYEDTVTAIVSSDTVFPFGTGGFKTTLFKYLSVFIREMQADTARFDTLFCKVQTSSDRANWHTIQTLTGLADTGSATKIWVADSTIHPKFRQWLRIFTHIGDTVRVAFDSSMATADGTPEGWSLQTDTSSFAMVNDADTTDYLYVTQPAQENLRPTGDGSLADWHSTAADTTGYSVVDEATLDTADYIYIAGADSIETFTMGNHTYTFASEYDSVQVIINARRVGSNVGALKFGVCLGDTSRCLWSGVDTLTASDANYTYGFALNPDDSIWTTGSIDSLMTALWSTTVSATAIKINQVYAKLYPTSTNGALTAYTVLSMGNRNYGHIYSYDSIQVKLNGRKIDTVTAHLAKLMVGMCLIDTSNCVWSDSIALPKADSTIYVGFPLSPNSAEWINVTVDSLLTAIRSVRCDSLSLKVNYMRVYLYPHAGELSPNVIYELGIMGKD